MTQKLTGTFLYLLTIEFSIMKYVNYQRIILSIRNKTYHYETLIIIATYLRYSIFV